VSQPMNFTDAVYQQLLQERIVFLHDELSDDTAHAISAQLLLLAADNPRRDIHLYLNSPGGSVGAGMAVYDTMQFVQADVATYAMGLVGSTAAVLLAAGTAGKRYALPHARVLLQQVSGAAEGTAADVAIQAEQLLYTKRMVHERIAFHTGQSVEQIAEDADRDRWFTAEQAKEYGFVDNVIPSVTALPSASLRVAGFHS
jgi:ATP-dependent Clp protease, protease subunit